MVEKEISLNEEQQKAVKTLEGPLLVLAGAGSGKTQVVTLRIVKLIQSGIPSWAILGLTFTNKAAEEMKERVKMLTEKAVLISTFHSLGARILRESIEILNLSYTSRFTIYDEEDALKLLKKCCDEFTTKFQKIDPKLMRSLISHSKNNFVTPDEIIPESTFPETALPLIYRIYQKRLEESNALDFDDLLYLPVRLFNEHPSKLEQYQNRWRYLLIDEFQDTNQAQYLLTKLLSAKSRNLCVVGDPDQSIYSWRGANLLNILNFEKDYPETKVIRLERNYRSRTNILNAANILIGVNRSRYEKNLWSTLGPGEKIKYFVGDTEEEEAQFVAEQVHHHHLHYHIPYNQMVVFYRTNAQSRPLEDSLLSRRIPYQIFGGISFYQRKEIKDALAFLKMVEAESDYISFMRTINLPKRGIGVATIEKIRLGAQKNSLSLLKYCARIIEEKSTSSSLNLSKKQKEGIKNYLTVIRELKRIQTKNSLKELVKAAIEQTGLLSFLKEDLETFEERRENLDELITKATEWELAEENSTLTAFLEELSLRTSLEEAKNHHDFLNLMTIHNGKGLEFTVVFLVGLEEDLFPHINAKGSTEGLEEERRLCYVGTTRAKELLFLSHARFRYIWGSQRMQRSSRFLQEIPSEYMEKIRIF